MNPSQLFINDDADDPINFPDVTAESLKRPVSPLLEAIKNYIKQEYHPSTDVGKCKRFTTKEIFEKINRIYPGAPITDFELGEWLYQEGFRFMDEGGLSFVWMMEKH